MKQSAVVFSLARISFFVFLFASCTSFQTVQPEVKGGDEKYQCLPCGSQCDLQRYKSAGACSQCPMQLVESSSVTFGTLEPNDVCAYMKNHPAAILLDVRTKEEYEGRANPDYGTLKNAINLPVQEMENNLSRIAHLKNKEVLVFCSHSHRSPRASYPLTQSGFGNVTNLNGGMSVVKDTAARSKKGMIENYRCQCQTPM